jgi:murein DD-endopeptidase MepM/ murein hydrolase activator NlpD
MQNKLNFKAIIGKPVPLRARYFTTKNNMPRLRYVSLLCAAVLLTGVSAFNGKNLHANNSAPAVMQVSDQAHNDAAYKLSQHPGPIGDGTLKGAAVIAAQPAEEMKMAYADIPDSLQNDIMSKVAAIGKNANSTIDAIKEQIKASAQSSQEDDAPSAPAKISVTLKKGGTLTGLLRKQGIGASEAYRAVDALSKHYNPRNMKPGLNVDILFGEDRIVDGETYKTIAMLDVPFDPIKSARVTLDDAGKFVSTRHEKEIVYREKSGEFDVEISLLGSAQKANVPYSVAAEAMRIYSWNVDFQRDLRKGDHLKLLYREATVKETGEPAGQKEILFAQLTLSDRDLPIYRMEFDDGRVDYFQEDGRSIRKALMRTPINGGRISSGFGMRKHPVLGYGKMHKGLDFAAPTGTKIYAAGDGVIEYIGRNGSFGNYVRIRHNSKLKTAYAHMNRFEKGLNKGDRVRQGDTIGRVGTTGRSTGAHLHYEVHVDGRQMNPRSVKLPTGEKLKGEMLTAFNRTVQTYQSRFAMLQDQIRVADASSTQGPKANYNE